MLGEGSIAEELIPWQSKIRILQHKVDDFIGKESRAAIRGRIIHMSLSFLKVYRGDIKEIELVVKRAFAAEPGQNAADWDMQKEFVLPISQAISIPKVGSWFREGVDIMTEQEIIDNSGNAHRPDRVVIYEKCVEVIDYKAGEILAKKNDISQVKRYVSLLSRIFDKDVKGYLLYIDAPLLINVL